MEKIALKTINYRGGIIQFRIPEHWQEEYEDAGGGTFYAPGDDTGTLRLNVLTAEAPPGQIVSSDTAAQVLEEDSRSYGVPIVSLRKGVAMLRYDELTQEENESLTLRYWQVSQALAPRYVRIAIFSYTLLTDQFSDAAWQEELAMLDREIAAAELSPLVGEEPKAKKPRRRPRDT